MQIHNWASDLEDPSIPSLEFVGVGKSYVVVNGEKTFLDVHQVGACGSAVAQRGCMKGQLLP